MNKTTVFVLIASWALSACTVVAEPAVPRVVVANPAPQVIITNGGNGGRFCPPGHAKKGHC